ECTHARNANIARIARATALIFTSVSVVHAKAARPANSNNAIQKRFILKTGAQGRIRTSVARKERQIYSLLPLTTRPPVQTLKLELMIGIEPMTSPLPRECSTH